MGGGGGGPLGESMEPLLFGGWLGGGGGTPLGAEGGAEGGTGGRVS